MANTTDRDVQRSKLNLELRKPGDHELFMGKIAEYNRQGDRSRHEIKLSGKRKMAIWFLKPGGWRCAIWQTTVRHT